MMPSNISGMTMLITQDTYIEIKSTPEVIWDYASDPAK